MLSDSAVWFHEARADNAFAAMAKARWFGYHTKRTLLGGAESGSAVSSSTQAP